MLKTVFIVFMLLMSFATSYAQGELSVKDTIANYNKIRIKTNLTGMRVLSIWGLANVATGVAGGIVADGETKYFFEMNTFFGATNSVFAAVKYQNLVRQAGKKVDANDAYRLYRRDKEFFIYKSLADVAIIGIGVGVAATTQVGKDAQATRANQQMYSGFGKSIVMQGVCMVAFDDIMAIIHNEYNHRWQTIMNEISFTGFGLAYVHHF